jgi:hypothetical protein
MFELKKAKHYIDLKRTIIIKKKNFGYGILCCRVLPEKQQVPTLKVFLLTWL